MIPPTTVDIPSQINRGLLLIGNGRKAEAQQLFSQLLQREIPGTDVLARFGELAFRLGEEVHAINALSRVVEAAPENVAYLDLYAQILISVRGYKKATELLKKAINLDANFQPPYVRLAAIYLEANDAQQAIPLLDKAVSLKPRDHHARIFMIGALRYENRYEEALEHALKLVRIAPKDPANLERLARVYIELGDFDEARRHLEQALRLNPAYGPAFNSLSSIHHFTPADEPIIGKAQAALKQSMGPSELALIHASLGKMYDDCRDWDKAFEHYRQANLLKKPSVEDDIERVVKRFRKARRTYSKRFIAKTQALGSESQVPVFVVGMPRSGTTLIEQIIARHSQGAGAGELSAMGRIERAMCPDESVSDYGKRVEASLVAHVLRRYAEEYVAALSRNHPGAVRVVDKMPMNFWHLGLIHLLFPGARIVHAVRNPLDTCLSCYFQPFETIKWSHDLGWIGSYYCAYREAMDHWKRVLPANRIIEVRYEDMVDDPEAGIRRLVEACGLPWEDRCLSFHRATRAIATASVWQARQPLYRTARGRWVHYAPHLTELAGRLKEFLCAEDIAEFERRGIRLRKRWRVGLGGR